jgi:two-component system response regulator PilR (NtrC family)
VETARRPLSVIVVEDERDLRELLVFALEVAELEVNAAASLAEARSLLDGPLKPDVLIADFSLPDGTGPDLLALCAAARPTLCMLLTGHDARDIPAGGFDVVLTKPVLPETLLGAIRSHFPGR